MICPTISDGSTITDVELEWQPIIGADSYELQIAKDEDFNQIEISAKLGSALDAAAQVECEATVRGTRIGRAQLTFMLKAIDSERVHEQRRYLYRLWTKHLVTSVRLP